MALTKKEKRDMVREAERQLQKDSAQSMARPKSLQREKQRAEKAENEVRVLRSRLAMNEMERKNAFRDGSEGGDEGSQTKGKGAASLDLLSL